MLLSSSMKRSRLPTLIVCHQCHASFRPWRPRAQFCSRQCLYLAQVGVNNPNWKTGKTLDVSGYIKLGSRRWEHRVLMERPLGRPLLETEYVHHKNRNRADNRISNLEVMTSKEHGK